MGRGGKQAYSTDAKTIQLAAATFYSDAHSGFIADTVSVDDPAWGGNVSKAANPPGLAEKTGHFYPTSIGFVNNHFLTLGLTEDPAPGKLGSGNMIIWDSVADEAADASDIGNHAIWMGLLVHSNQDYVKYVITDGGGSAAGGTTDRWNVTTLAGENDLYLNEIPKSAGVDNGAAAGKAGGYTWIVGKNGVVYGVYFDGTNYYNGFSGGYP
jgi:hypothetical protein